MRKTVKTGIIIVAMVMAYAIAFPRHYESQKISVKESVSRIEEQALMDNWQSHFNEVISKLQNKLSNLKGRKVDLLIESKRLVYQIREIKQRLAHNVDSPKSSTTETHLRDSLSSCETLLGKQKVLLKKINSSGLKLEQSIKILKDKKVALEGKEHYANSLRIINTITKKWSEKSYPVDEDLDTIKEIEKNIERMAIEAEVYDEIEGIEFDEAFSQ